MPLRLEEERIWNVLPERGHKAVGQRHRQKPPQRGAANAGQRSRLAGVGAAEVDGERAAALRKVVAAQGEGAAFHTDGAAAVAERLLEMVLVLVPPDLTMVPSLMNPGPPPYWTDGNIRRQIHHAAGQIGQAPVIASS